jgi:hypothetical protein
LHDVERLARGDAAEHVEQHDVAQLLEPDKVGERAADIAGADEGDLVAGHTVPHRTEARKERPPAVVRPPGRRR